MTNTEAATYQMGRVLVTRGAATLALIPHPDLTDQLNVAVLSHSGTFGRPLAIGHIYQTPDGRWTAVLSGPPPTRGMSVRGTFGSIRDALASMQEDADYYLATKG